MKKFVYRLRKDYQHINEDQKQEQDNSAKLSVHRQTSYNQVKSIDKNNNSGTYVGRSNTDNRYDSSDRRYGDNRYVLNDKISDDLRSNNNSAFNTAEETICRSKRHVSLALVFLKSSIKFFVFN